MKKLKSKMMALALCVGVLSGFGLELAGCSQQQEKPPVVDNGGSQTNPNTDKNKPSTNPGQDKDDSNQDPPVVNPPKEAPADILERGVEKFDSFVDQMIVGRNFTYSQSDLLGGNFLAEIDKTKAKLTENEKVTYFEENGGQNFSYVWNNKIGLWEKDFSETNADTLISSIQSALDGVRWGVYDEKNQKLGGIGKVNVGGFEVNASVQVDMSSEGEMTATIGAGNQNVTMQVNKMGSTEVTLPTKEQVSDKTVPSENVYEIVDGQYQWNIKLLADIFDKWMKGDNQYGSDIYSQTSPSVAVKDILFVSPDHENNFTIGIVAKAKENSNEYFVEFKFLKDDFYSHIKKGDLQSSDDFVGYLMSTKLKDFTPTSSGTKIEYSTGTATLEQKKEFEAMTKNVFDRLETIGVQKNGANTSGEKTSKFANAKVLFGFKTPNGGTIAGENLGNRQGWRQYYLLDVNGKIEFVKFIVSGSVDGIGTAVDKVVNNDSSKWLISTLEEKELDVGNKNLFNTYWYANTKDKEK